MHRRVRALLPGSALVPGTALALLPAEGASAAGALLSPSSQVFSERGSSSPRRAPTSELYDVCLVQTDLLEAIADEDYFLRCVRRCEENYDRYLACTEKDTPSQRCDGQ